jgi:hypothetical protein
VRRHVLASCVACWVIGACGKYLLSRLLSFMPDCLLDFCKSYAVVGAELILLFAILLHPCIVAVLPLCRVLMALTFWGCRLDSSWRLRLCRRVLTPLYTAFWLCARASFGLDPSKSGWLPCCHLAFRAC